jgi:hypothetical protein
MLLVLCVATALLLAASGLAAAQVNTDPTGTGPTGGDPPNPDDVVVPPDSPPVVGVGDSTSGGAAVAPDEDAPSADYAINEQGLQVVAPDEDAPSTEEGFPAKMGITREGVEGVFVPVGGPDYLKQGEYIKQGATIPGIDIIVEKKPGGEIVAEQGAEGLFVPESEIRDPDWPTVKDHNSSKSNTAALAAQDVESEEGVLVPASNLEFGTDEEELQTQGVPGIFAPETDLGYGINEQGLQVQGIIDPKSGQEFVIKDDGTLLHGAPGFLKAIGQVTAEQEGTEQEGESSVEQGEAEEPAAESESGFFAGIWNFFKSIFG